MLYAGESTSAARFTDHRGCFKRRGLEAKTPPNELDQLLRTHCHALAKTSHPDMRDSQEQMQKINEAYEKLGSRYVRAIPGR